MDDLDLPSAVVDPDGAPPPLGPYRTFQVPITDIADLTDLDLQQLATLDRLPVPATAGPDTPRWRRLANPTDIIWQRASAS